MNMILKSLIIIAGGLGSILCSFGNLSAAVNGPITIGKEMSGREVLISPSPISVDFSADNAYSKTASQEVEVKVNMNANDIYSPLRFMIYNDQTLVQGTGGSSVRLPKGSYDICAEFVCGQYYSPYFARVFRENVELTDDAVFTLDVEEAVNTIVFESVLADGSKVILPYSGNADGPASNAERIVIYTMAAHEDYKYFTYGVGEASFTGTKGSAEISFGFKVNDVSEKYHFMQSRLVRINENEVMYHCPVVHGSGSGSRHIANSAEAVVSYDEEFQLTPLSRQFNRMQDNYMCQGLGVFQGIDLGGFAATFGGEDCRIWIVDNSIEDPDPIFQPVVYAGALDAQDLILSFDDRGNITGQEKIQTGVYGCPVTVRNGEVYHINPNNITLDNTSVIYPEKNYLHGHNAFCYAHDTKQAPFAANTPFTMVMPKVGVMEGGRVLLMNLGSIGRWGENRRSDMYQLGASIWDANGNILMEGTHHGISEALVNGAVNGSHGFVLKTTNRNVEVDGEPVVSEMEMSWDNTKDNIVPPTLTMLQTRDKKGCLTDRFDGPSDGVIEFTGGIFLWDDDFGGYREYAATDVKVECKPEAGEFMELEVEEVPELYHMPAFGHFYRASTHKVSSAGWYTLRITLSDEYDNRQIQTLERAFSIADVSGVDRMSDGKNLRIDGSVLIAPTEGVKVEVYDLTGVCRLEATLTESLDLSDYLTKGLYMISYEVGTSRHHMRLMVR